LGRIHTTIYAVARCRCGLSGKHRPRQCIGKYRGSCCGTLRKTAGSIAKASVEAGFKAGFDVATMPLREAAKALSGEVSPETLSEGLR
jgi:hypothetical protein